MTRLAIALALTLAAGAAMAKGGNESGPASVISYTDLPRTLVFNETRNSIDAAGRLLVCLPQHKANWTDVGKCLDANGQNAWSLAENALPGWRLGSYEIRFSGSSGQRNLLLYFKQ